MSIRTPPPSLRTGVQGHLRLVADVNIKGESYLREQSFRAPVHLSKTFLNNGVLIANVVSPTAGLLAGDRLEIDVRVEKKARFVLTNPAATRVHTMRDGIASVRQKFAVTAGGWLEVWPDLFIPHAGARYRQSTDIRVETGGEMLFFELLTPGRVAFGETFAFDQLDWETDIRYGETLIVRERYSLSPTGPSLYPLRARFPHAYHANAFVIGETLTASASCWPLLQALHGEDLWLGYSRLTQGGWVIKLLARDSLALRRGLDAVRNALYAAAGWPQPALRKV